MAQVDNKDLRGRGKILVLEQNQIDTLKDTTPSTLVQCSTDDKFYVIKGDGAGGITQHEIKIDSKYFITDVEMFGIASPITGKSYFNTNRLLFVFYNGISWAEIDSSPIWDILYDEDFEGGVIPTGMTVVEDGVDKFMVGAYGQPSGSNYGLYGSNDGGATDNYSDSVVYHIYFEMAIPDVNAWRMTGLFRCPSEVGFDFAKVYLCDTTTPLPQAGVELIDNGTTIRNVGEIYQGVNIHENRTIECGDLFVEETVRIVISFKSDSSVHVGHSSLNLAHMKIETQG